MRPHNSTNTVDTVVSIDGNAETPLHQQIYDGLRDAIVSGRLRAGARLPATRMLADNPCVSRNTVILAYDELAAEGYLERRARGGTFVARTLPETSMRLRRGAGNARVATELRGPARVLSARGQAIAGMLLPASVNTESAPRAFRPGVPALDAFPAELWGRLVARHWRSSSPRALAYGHSAGYRPLREAIASYIAAARGVRCTAEEILIVGGAQQALDIATRVLLDPGDRVWLEDPGYVGARAAFMAAGAQIVPVRVDSDGLDVAEGERLAPDARMVFVSPSHQHPLGATMPNARRVALLDWARRADAWIIEDDYDSEIRYRGRPLMSLQGLDRDGRVIYVGTFSKTLFPALRLGYVVVPPRLASVFATARLLSDRHSSIADQAVLAEFISAGHYARHVRRMRGLYAERQDALLEEGTRSLAGLVEISRTDAGMNAIAWLPPGVDDVAAYRAALVEGVEAPPLSPFAQAPLERGALILNFAGYDPMAIHSAAPRLASALRRVATAMGQRAG
jgi:GntR family transcriptional regulator / MocR family aminotransferase